MVDYSILFWKLSKYGTGGEEIRSFLGFLHDRKHRVRVGEAESQWNAIQRRVLREF